MLYRQLLTCDKFNEIRKKKFFCLGETKFEVQLVGENKIIKLFISVMPFGRKNI